MSRRVKCTFDGTMLSIQKILNELERRAPASAAESWDNVGLLVGNAKTQTPGVVIADDFSRDALELAKKKNFKLIVNHHPCIFPRPNGLSKLTVSSSENTLSSLIHEAIQNDISVIACHTNFDRCALEVPEKISEVLQLAPKGRLFEFSSKDPSPLLKLCVFVPGSHLELLREVICHAGAGVIGNYDFCTFQIEGIGTFRGNENAQPFIGKAGELSRENEVRLEVLFPRTLQNRVLEAMKKAHPYEEVAFDLFPVEQRPTNKGLSFGQGYGFYGDFNEAISFEEMKARVKKAFTVESFLATSPFPKTIKRLGFVAGKGASFVKAAASAGCDVFLTGEAGYHAALEGARLGMQVIEMGHRESEFYFLRVMQEWLTDLGLSTEVSEVATQKFIS